MAISHLSFRLPPVKSPRYKPLDKAGIPPIWRPLLRFRLVGLNNSLWIQVRCRACGYERLVRQGNLTKGSPRSCPACHAFATL